MDMLNSNSYCLLCFIVLLHVKIKILKKFFTSLIICCLNAPFEIIQVLAFEFVLLANEFVLLANEFVPLAIEFIALAFEFVALPRKFVRNKIGSWSEHENK